MKSDRRNFLKTTLQVAAFSAIYPSMTSFIKRRESVYELNSVIDTIEIFRYDINIPRYFSWGTWLNRQHLFMKISSGNYHGWSEIPASVNNPDFNPANWVEFLKPYKGLTVNKAFEMLAKQQENGDKYLCKQFEFTEMGLLDLAGKLQNKPAIELLNLTRKDSVPGLFCILDKDIGKVRKNALLSIEQNLNGYMKLKMYGDSNLDISILKTAREVLGNESIVISDANKGYKNWQSLDELTNILIQFRENGLNAIEDPSKLSVEQWIELQNKVGTLDLIPDDPLRPAWIGLATVKPGMGRIYNLHPSVMGSFSYVAKLALKVQSFNAQIMIGDDSLVGPACTAWQQIAIGVGAVWVEAIEKKGDSDEFIKCITSRATFRNPKGTFSLDPKPGFGLEIDIKRLKEICPINFKIQ